MVLNLISSSLKTSSLYVLILKFYKNCEWVFKRVDSDAENEIELLFCFCYILLLGIRLEKKWP